MGRQLRSKASSQKTKTPKQAKSVQAKKANNPDPEPQSTAYERLFAKVQENKRKREAAQDSAAPSTPKRGAKSAKLKEVKLPQPSQPPLAVARFSEDDNYVEMEVREEQDKEDFPTPSEEEGNISDDGEILELTNSQQSNNNASITVAQRHSTERSSGAVSTKQLNTEQLPSCPEVQPSTSTNVRDKPSATDANLSRTVTMLQEILLKKGVMTNEEMSLIMDENGSTTQTQTNTEKEPIAVASEKQPGPIKHNKKGKVMSKGRDVNSLASSSEVTIYRRAVQQVAPKIESRIDQFINEARQMSEQQKDQQRKILSSSDELMDTSDEIELITGANTNLFPFAVNQSEPEPQQRAYKEKTLEEKANETIREAEQSRAQLLDIPGKGFSVQDFKAQSILDMDNDYQMIDAHVDETMRKHILNFDFIDLSKLLSKNKVREEDARLEIVNRNGMTFLSPVSERDAVKINSYRKWEQAFHIYANVITSKYPEKAPELLQYNHTIHSASTTYSWENVYAYDREFRYHISRHPTRVWNVILQQAWKMLLKDRIHWGDNQHGGGRNNGSHNNHNKWSKSPCRHFSKGRCTFGLNYKFDHRCSVRKCGKFGHGAHQCRLRDTATNSDDNKIESSGGDSKTAI